MGIQTSQGGGKAVFFKINARDGCLQQRENGVTHQFESGKTVLEGTLIGVKYEEDEYQGVKSESVRLIFKDTTPGEPNMHVSMTVVSDGRPTAFAIKALSKINATEPGQPISINPFLIKAGETLGTTTFDSDFTGLSVSQNGQKMKEDLGTPDNKLPDCPVVMVNGKPFIQQGREVKDRSPWVPILEAQLDKLFARFQPAQGENESVAPGIDPTEVAAAAASAAPAPAPSRDGMRARA